MAIQKLFTSRDNGIDAANYVGQEGRMFYDTATGNLRLSDGVTPGGVDIQIDVSVAQIGNLVVNDTTITSISPNANINMITDGTGALGFYGNGGFNIYQDGVGSNVAFKVLPSGYVTHYAPNIPSGTSGALNIIGSANGDFQNVNGAGGMIHITGNPDTSARITVDGWTTSATAPQPPTAIGAGLITFRAGRGTPTTPLPMKSGDHLGTIAALGYTGSGMYSQGQTGLLFYAAEDFTSNSAIGTYANLQVTPIGTNVAVTSVRFNSDGIVTGNVTATNVQAGNVYIGDNTIYNVVEDNDLYVATSGTGAIEFDTNGFTIKTTTNPDPVFNVDNQGQVKILAPTFDANIGAVSIVGSSSGNSLPPGNPGGMFHVTGLPGAPSRMFNDASNGYALYTGRRFNGTVEAPTQVLADDVIARYSGSAYNSGGTFAPFGVAKLDYVAAEDQTATAQGSRIEVWTTPIGTNALSKVMSWSSTGITFASDGSVQNTAGIPLTYLGNALGVATLDGSGKVPNSQLPAGAVVYKGTWNASTNTPTLADGVGTSGWEYSVSVGGTVNFGSGPITFNAGDFVIYSGTVWQQITTAAGVTSFNTRTGAVVLSSSDVTTALTYTPYNGATNPNGYVNSAQAGAAAPVQSFNTRVGAVVLSSSDVTTALTSGSLTNAKLANSNVIIGSTTISLGSTVTAITGLTSIAATTFTGSLSGTATTAGTVTTNAQPNITSTGTLTTLSVSGNANIGNIGTGGLLSVTGNANVGNLNVASSGTITAPRLIINDGGLRTITNGTSATVDFSADSIIYWNTPSGTATVTLTNYTAGARVKLIIRVGGTSRDINYGVAAVDNSTTGAVSFNGSGPGSISIANQAFVLDYTCIDTTAANCYVQVSWQ